MWESMLAAIGIRLFGYFHALLPGRVLLNWLLEVCSDLHSVWFLCKADSEWWAQEVHWGERKPDGTGRAPDRWADVTEIQSRVSLMRGPAAKVILRRSPVWGGNSQVLESHYGQSLARGSPRRPRPRFQLLLAPQRESVSQIPPYGWTVRSFLKEIQAAPLHGCPGPRVCPSAVVLSPNIPHLWERSHTEIQGGRKSLVVAFEFPNNWSFLQVFGKFFLVGPCHEAGILVPRPGIPPVPPAVEVES